MILLEDIKAREIVKVLVDLEGVEEPLYAKVLKNCSGYLMVTYLIPSEKVYKGACVYNFNSKVDMVYLENLCEHHDGVVDIESLNITRVSDNSFVFDDEIDVDDQCEDIFELDDEDDDDSIVVSDDEGLELPHDHVLVDEEWNKWHPSTQGGRTFKQTIDRLEAEARLEMDNQNFGV